MKVSFIVHRPYHLIRSIDLALKLRNEYNDVSISVFIFDLVFDLKERYSKTREFHSDFELEELFDHVVLLSRVNEVSIFNIKKFIPYYNSINKKYSDLVQKNAADNVFIFSDKEKPIEVFIALYKQKGANVLLVDEGFASYSRKPNLKKFLSKKLMVSLFNFKNVSNTIYYGESQFVDKVLVNLPGYTTIKNEVAPLPKLNLKSLNKFYKVKQLVYGKSVVYISNIIGYNFEISWDDEVKFLRDVYDLSKNNGYNVIIKPHPVEEDSKYKELSEAIVLDKKYPSELLFNDENIFISVKSSVLINARIASQKTVDISKIFGIDNQGSIFSKLEIPAINHIGELFTVSKDYLPDSVELEEPIRKIIESFK